MVTGSQPVLDGLLQPTLGEEPVGGSPQQDRSCNCPILVQFSAQYFSEQSMTAVPPPAQCRHEQAGAFKFTEYVVCAGRSQYGIAQRSRQPLQYRALHQQVVFAASEVGDDLSCEVVQDVPAVFTHLGHHQVRVLGLPEGKCSQMQAGRPPFGALDESGGTCDIRNLRRSDDPCEQLRAFGGCAPQVQGTYLAEVSPSAQPRQRQRRVGPAGYHKMQGGRQIGQQELDALGDV